MADKLLERIRVATGQWIVKTFRLGIQVLPSDEGWGLDPATYSPEEYGTYIATSVPIYACANLRAKNLAKLPIRLWKVDLRGNKTEVTKGKLFDLLHTVNPFWSVGRLIRMTELARCLWGVSYWMLERGQTGKQPPQEIWWARPDKVRVVPHHVDYITGFIYESLGQRQAFAKDEVIWLPMDNPIDEFSGLSPIAAARVSADLGTAALKSNKKLFDQGMQLGGIVSPKQDGVMWTKGQTEEIENMLRRRFSGIDKAHRWAVFSGGINATALGVNPKDAEFLNQMRWSLGDVGRVYHVAPELLGDNEHATYNNVESAWKALWSDCIIPEGQEIAENLTEFLLPMFPGEADEVGFDTTGISALQEDRTEIVDQMSKLWAMGVPLNRLLQEFQPNLLPEAGNGYPWGEVGYLSGTMLPAGQAAEAPPDNAEEGIKRAIFLLGEIRQSETKLLPEPAPEFMDYGSPEHKIAWKKFARRTERQEEKFASFVSDLFRRQQESVLARLRSKAANGIITKAVDDEPFDLAQWGKTFKQESTPLFHAIIEDAGADALGEIGVAVDFDLTNPEFIRFLEQRAQRFAREVNQTTWNNLKSSLSEGIDAGESISELMKRVEATMTQRRSSSETIARTEVIGATNGGALIAAKQSGVVDGKRWLAALDNRTRESHIRAHGQTVKLDDDFHVGDGSGPAPGQIGIAEEDIQCRCTLTWVVK